eukprot:91562-Amphidinium_carterae.1
MQLFAGDAEEVDDDAIEGCLGGFLSRAEAYSLSWTVGGAGWQCRLAFHLTNSERWRRTNCWACR